MPLFEISGDDLVPFRRVASDATVYEKEIEDLLWENVDAFVGESLFLVARQKKVRGDGVPDVIAIDHQGSICVIEVKRHIDRRQLAQCLEYAGWARSAGLDELASMYADGAEAFFDGWTEFTGTNSPALIAGSPRLFLIARDFDSRTSDALDFLTASNLPVEVLRVTLYHDESGRRFIDIDGDHESDFTSPVAEARTAPVHLKLDGKRVQVADLLDNGLLEAGQQLTWFRKRSGVTHKATVTSEGKLRLEDGQDYATPSRAATKAVGSGSFDGWNAWRTASGALLHELRSRLVEASEDEQSD